MLLVTPTPRPQGFIPQILGAAQAQRAEAGGGEL